MLSTLNLNHKHFKRYITYRCLNIISNVLFLLKYELILNIVTTLVSLNERVNSSDLMTLLFSILLFLTKLICFLFITNWCFALISQSLNVQHSALHTKLLYLFGLCFQNYVWLFCKNITFRYIQASWGGEKKNHNWE